ncbi:hypothetical protein [Amnibacterium setariae]|uniref:hypothetical protein n=1 Tax=Amnibacterium setariae TaxID=2306585 RepID=UPI0011C38228|nr:hypothetical protein [Amnibacterium setariae]
MTETRDGRLRAAREAAYRRDATPEDLARLAALEPSGPGGPHSPGGPDGPLPVAPHVPSQRRRRGATAVVGVAALLVGALLGGAAVAALRPATAPERPAPAATEPGGELRARILASNGTWSAQDYFRFYPGQLPAEWSDSPTGRSYVQLTGPRRLRISPSDGATALLVVPTCAASEGRYRWTVRAADGRALAEDAGRCGGFDGRSLRIPDGARPLVLEIATQGVSGYAVTTFER